MTSTANGVGGPGAAESNSAACGQCGLIDDGRGTCRQIFERLLALEYSVAVPFGRLHGITVPAYYCQHLDDVRGEALEVYWATLHAYARGGMAELGAAWKRINAANSHRFGGRPTAALDLPAPPVPGSEARPRHWTRTIADLLDTDGELTAPGHEERVHVWVCAILDDFGVQGDAWPRHLGPAL